MKGKIMDDKKRPYKMYAAMAGAAVSAAVAEWVNAPAVALVIATSLVAGLAAYAKSNPKVEE